MHLGYDTNNNLNPNSSDANTEATFQEKQLGANSGNQQNNNSSRFSMVSATANKKKFMLAGLVGFITIVLYWAFFSGDKKSELSANEKLEQQERLLKNSVPVTQSNSGDNYTSPPATPALPEPAALGELAPPQPPLPPVPDIPQTPFLQDTNASNILNLGGGGIFGSDKDSIEEQQRLQARRSEGIIVFGGGGGAAYGDTKSDDKEKSDDKKEGEEKEKPKKSNADFLGFGDGQLNKPSLNKTAASQVPATKMGNMSTMIAQGKIIHAVLETAINTDIPGMLRAIVSRDVYAESGKRILVPKGSRLVGEYDSTVKNGQTRVSVMWNRVILPTGIDIAINSAGVDALGRAGVKGQLNNKFWSRLTSAFLISFIIPYGSYKMSGTTDSPTSQTTSVNETLGTTITTISTSSTKAELAADSAQKFSDVTSELVKSFLPEKPTIFVPQGTEINIVAQHDIPFPDEAIMNNMAILK
jgi:type IV secretion system protein VirB10